jgi:hypothetical protein
MELAERLDISNGFIKLNSTDTKTLLQRFRCLDSD